MDNETHAEMPSGMREVSQEEFFNILASDPRDIMPSITHPYQTWWKVIGRGVVGAVWGWSWPGWKNSGSPLTPKVYAVREESR